VERSVTIAAIATRELTIKDFALEPNEEKMRKSAHMMVQRLSGIYHLFVIPYSFFSSLLFFSFWFFF